ncbi:MAG: putative quinol monooxygenase [Halioglobus sp.]
MPHVTLQGFIIVPDDDLDAVLNELPIHSELTRQEPGCLSFDVAQDPANRNRFNVHEVFASEAAFEHHQSRARTSPWGQVSLRAERHYTVTIK